MKTKKVVFVIEEFNSSGGLKIVTAIANTLVDAGFNVQFVVPKYTKEPFYPLKQDIEISYLGLNKLGCKIGYFLQLFFKIGCFSGTIVTPNYRIAVIHHFILFPKKNPFVFLIQGDDSVSLIRYSSSNRFVKWLNNGFLILSKKTDAKRIFVSNFLMNNSIKKGKMIPNYISDIFFDTRKREFFFDNCVTIGTVSSSAPNKGFDFYLRFLDEIQPLLKVNNKKYRFLCATQDKLLKNACYRHNIEFYSPKTEEDMNVFYKECDIYLSCSISEGFNLPVLEAMASGCIVVSLNDGGVTDFIDHGQNGFIVEKRKPEFVCELVNDLIINKDTLDDVQSKAMIKATQYTKMKFDTDYLNYFNEITL